MIAHIKKETGDIQSIQSHLQGTAELAGRFAAIFNNQSWGECLGYLHDIGKLSDEFQNYIRQFSEYEEGNIDEPIRKKGKVDHSSAGAILAKEVFGRFWPPLAYCVAGHHAGLLNWEPSLGYPGDMKSRLNKIDSLEKVRSRIISVMPQFKSPELPCGKEVKPEHMHMWIRMLFSCLVDADFLDTERFMTPESFQMRSRYNSLRELKDRFDLHMKTLSESAAATRVNSIRNQILQQCIAMGAERPGFFSITVPTGGGKTLASMAWALEHALKFNRSRIIFAIPYTSITAQTAAVYRKIFGSANVIEHHSNIDSESETQENKLASENWDAPIIITTNVQLFESLYAKKTSRCRKLHNIAESIIILDEAQMLPPDFLKPILGSLKALVENFGVSVLLSTATQPALTGKIGTGQNAFRGIDPASVMEIIPDNIEISEQLKRVNILLPEDVNEPVPMEKIADELGSYEQCLCIVNTRKECHSLYKLMPDDTLHLSRMMCVAHVNDVIAEIKSRLKEQLPVRVISTQLIEAGVDVDFPVVYRAIAGLDSVAQSAGRCNREGKLDGGKGLGIVKVFVSEKPVSKGLMSYGADTLKEFVSKEKGRDLLSPELFRRYFESYYAKVHDFDEGGIENLLVQNARAMKFQFAEAANSFRLIDDRGSKNILVAYSEGAELLELFKRKGPEPWLMRKLQQYSVTVNKGDFDELIRMQRIEQIHGIYIQADAWLYNSRTGLTYGDEWSEEILTI